MIFVEFLFMET